MSAKVLILPGWQGSGPEHWQMRWVAQQGYTVVEQADWLHPRRGDWLARLDEVVVDTHQDQIVALHGGTSRFRRRFQCSEL